MGKDALAWQEPRNRRKWRYMIPPDLLEGGRVGGQNMTTRVHGLNLSDRVWYKTLLYILNYYNLKGVNYQCKSEFFHVYHDLD